MSKNFTKTTDNTQQQKENVGNKDKVDKILKEYDIITGDRVDDDDSEKELFE